MDVTTLIILAVLYAFLVFTICYFKKLKFAIMNFFSKNNIKFLRNKNNEHPLGEPEKLNDVERAVEPVLLAWRDADENKLPARMDKTFLERMQRMIKVFKKHSVKRDIKTYGMTSELNNKGQNGFTKWNEYGREWREGVLSGAVLDMFTDTRSGNIVHEKYFPKVKISIVQSRHLRFEDAKKAAKARKDKFGYTKKQKPEENIYNETKTIVCNSCGAEIQINANQVTCPYCGGRLISAFHDWQTEHISIEPVSEYPFKKVAVNSAIAFVSSLIIHILQFIFTKKVEFTGFLFFVVIAVSLLLIFGYKFLLDKIQQKRKKQIVRFSEHQFKRCVYEELWEKYKTLDILDFFIGDIEIKDVKNTEEKTEVTVSLHIFTQIYKTDGIMFEKENWSGVFTRARYPERLKSSGEILYEKDCPSCRSNFVPDSKGCCSYCGYSLKISNAKWKLLRETK